MTEVLPRGVERSSSIHDHDEQAPSLEAQEQFFREALLEATETDVRPRLIRGPLYNDFHQILTIVDAHIKAVDPTFTSEHIIPTSYQSKTVRTDVSKLEPRDRVRLGDIKNAKHAALRAAVARYETREDREVQQLMPGVLDIPPYAPQKDDWDHFESTRGCANACFRMVFGAITGWVPLQKALSTQLVEQYDTSVVEDYVYSALYDTPAFKDACKKEITTLEMLGANLSTINKFATALKTRRKDVEIYCTLNLASATAGEGVWHSVVLLEGDDERIVCHDPALSGGAYSVIPYEQFVARWATSYNRAVLTIAA